MFGIFKKKKKRGPLVYLSEPTLLYHTKTERIILEIIEEKLNSTNVIKPSDYGLRDISDRIAEVDYVVAVAIKGKFSSLVCREVSKAKKFKKKIYTLDIARDLNSIIYVFSEGIPEHIEWLDERQTQEFFNEFLAKDFIGASFKGFFLGYRNHEW
ncbi:hypothetical protein PNA2_1558 [Pyrococcus sp. NA2]|uniref:hypothetical protein n=1 Tax=Pyrococcus sp. (strain NA2) TaxID=342949 RepID=UPI000209A92F|nr:hypothetical protein [Pyrococcus sp. NA2]AEC52473.1 hypothetical protein PNA2_1558 [Pyrococcus sp. NA2]